MRLFLFLLIFFMIGCSTTQNYAPVRSYHRDLINGEKYYIVKSGDTLYYIGFRSGHGYKRLSCWNKISSPYKLLVGQKLKLFKPKQKLRKDTRPEKRIKSTLPEIKEIKNNYNSLCNYYEIPTG